MPQWGLQENHDEENDSKGIFCKLRSIHNTLALHGLGSRSAERRSANMALAWHQDAPEHQEQAG